MSEYRHIRILHRQIIEDNIRDDNDIVEKFRREHPLLIYAHDDTGNSAAFIALKCDKLNIYNILIANGFSLDPTENINVLVEEICKSRGILERDDEAYRNEALKVKKSLRLIHLSYFKSASHRHRHLNILSWKSKLSLSTSDGQRRYFRELIDRAFEDLNEIEYIVPLLKLAASSDCLQIIFDFHKGSVEHMDPTGNSGTMGVTYPISGTIYIGAEGLLDDSTKFKVLGVLAHELCHYSMKLVYNNGCKPYAQNCAKLEIFQEITEFCRNYKDADDIIGLVFEGEAYSPERYHAELIVRVPHLMALHKSNKSELEDRQQKFPRLFDFYLSTIEDMKLKLERDDALATLHMVNVMCGVLTRSENPEIYNIPGDLKALKLYSSDNVATNCTELVSIYKKLKATDKFYSFTSTPQSGSEVLLLFGRKKI